MGTYNSQGVYFYAESDLASPFSDTLNIAQTATSNALNTLGSKLSTFTALPTRYALVTASGTITTALGAFPIIPTQSIPAQPFGAVDWRVNVDAWLNVALPSGLGASLDVRWNGTLIANDTFTNPGTSSHTMTLKVRSTAWVAAATTSVNSLTVTVTALGGTISIPASNPRGAIAIEASPRRGF